MVKIRTVQVRMTRDQYDRIKISPDGQRFLMIKEGEQTADTSEPTQLIVVENWFEELKRLVPTP